MKSSRYYWQCTPILQAAPHVLLESEGNEIQSVVVYDQTGKLINKVDGCCQWAVQPFCEWMDGWFVSGGSEYGAGIGGEEVGGC